MTASWVITCDADVAAGAAWLARQETRFAEALAQTGPLPLRLRPGGFQGLVDIIISQQVSVASADAIRGRMVSAGLVSEAAVLSAGEDGLRAAGLSRPKARYVQLLAQEQVDYAALQALPQDQAMAALMGLTGIGPWTAEIYVMFCMGAPDVFPAGDLALQVAAQDLFDLPERPKPEALRALAEDWSPWRSVAARALFAYYRVIKNREGFS